MISKQFDDALKGSSSALQTHLEDSPEIQELVRSGKATPDDLDNHVKSWTNSQQEKFVSAVKEHVKPNLASPMELAKSGGTPKPELGRGAPPPKPPPTPPAKPPPSYPTQKPTGSKEHNPPSPPPTEKKPPEKSPSKSPKGGGPGGKPEHTESATDQSWDKLKGCGIFSESSKGGFLAELDTMLSQLSSKGPSYMGVIYSMVQNNMGNMGSGSTKSASPEGPKGPVKPKTDPGTKVPKSGYTDSGEDMGSGLTKVQEAAALSGNSTISAALKAAATSYQTDVNTYWTAVQKPGATTSDKSTAYSAIVKQYDALYNTDPSKGALGSVVTTIIGQITTAGTSSGTGLGMLVKDSSTGKMSTDASFLTHLSNVMGNADANLKIPAKQAELPPDESKNNVLASQPWKHSAGAGAEGDLPPDTTNQDPNSPVAPINSYTPPAGSTYSKTVTTVPGAYYLVGGYVQGTPASAKDEDDGKAFSGAITVDGAKKLQGKDLSQPTNEIDSPGLHRRFFWVQASGSSMTVSISGSTEVAGQPNYYKDISAYQMTGTGGAGLSPQNTTADFAKGDQYQQFMQFSNEVFPPPLTTGPADAGGVPQVKAQFGTGSGQRQNLMDGKVSEQYGISTAPGKNAGHPYWWYSNSQVKTTEGPNGNHGVELPAQGSSKDAPSATSNGPVPIPALSSSGKNYYRITVDVNVTNGPADFSMSFGGNNLKNNSKISQQKFSETLSTGEHKVTFNVPLTAFSNCKEGDWIQPSVNFSNLSGSSKTDGSSANAGFEVFNMQMKPMTMNPASPAPTGDAPGGADDTVDNDIYTQINAINPYSSGRSWALDPNASPPKKSQTTDYDFTKANVSSDWAMGVTGNTMYAPGEPFQDYTKKTAKGIQLLSTSDPSNTKTPYAGGGIQSTQFVPGGVDFNISMTFTGTASAGYAPTLALWGYGENNPNPWDPSRHTNGAGADSITEFDCEMGSNNKNSTPNTTGKTLLRPGSYIGTANGGKTEYTGKGNWPSMGADIWNHGVNPPVTYTISMTGTYAANGDFFLDSIVNSNNACWCGTYYELYAGFGARAIFTLLYESRHGKPLLE